MKKKTNKSIFFNDPIYGFIVIDSKLILRLIEHPYFQRLRRIAQMGLSYMVYPGAHHTRFEHALGCMHLMQNAIAVLRSKGISISTKESEAMRIAILLHDIGHGPFSHALESVLTPGISHETLSLKIMQQLNTAFDGALTLAIAIFKGEYTRKFMHQLVVGQIDIDRLDYLKRDSFYTGVTEGNINTDRILQTLNVQDEALVFEEKGIYSLEKFLLARRLMYWQVYLHKTSLGAEYLLIKTIDRAKEVYINKTQSGMSTALQYFLNIKADKTALTDELLNHYLQLDDSDITQALKLWQTDADPVLSLMAASLVNRKLLTVKISNTAFSAARIAAKQKRLKSFKIPKSMYHYFVFSGTISNQMYSLEKGNIELISKTGVKIRLERTISYLDFEQFSSPQRKHYLCYPKRSYLP